MSRSIQYTPITLESLQAEILRLRQEMAERIRQTREQQAAIDRQILLDELERQRIELENRIAQLSGTNEGLKREMLKRLNDQAKDFERGIKAMENSTAKSIAEMKKSIDKVDNKLSGRIDKVDTKVDAIGKSVDGIIEKFKKEEKQASEMAAEVNRILKDVMARTPVERYTPGPLKKIVADIAVANSNLPAASNIAIIHQIIRDIVHMEEEANRRRLAHEALLAAARSQASALSGFHKSHEAVEVDAGNGKKAKLDANFWTHGKYGGIGAEVADITRQLEADRDAKGEFLTDEEVVRLGGELERLQAETVGSIADTSRLATESQNRFQMIRKLVNNLRKDGGWTVVQENGEDAFDFLGSENQDKDTREGFFVILKKGNEVLTLTIVEKDGKPNLVLQNTFVGGNTPTRQHLDDRRVELGKRLEAMGFPAGTLSGKGGCVSDDPLPEMSSAKALQGKGGAKAIRTGIENSK